MTLSGSNSHRKFDFFFISADYQVSVQGFTAEESVSELYTVHLSLVSEDQILPTEVVGTEGCLTLSGGDADRLFHGIINRFSLVGRNGRFFLYQVKLVPCIWLLSLNSSFKIFQNKNVVEIVEELLKAGLSTHLWEFRLLHSYEKRRYCTQYGESDWKFIARLLAEEGIFFFFEHFPDSHRLIFADDKTSYLSIAGEPMVRYDPGDGMVAETETLTSFIFSRGIKPGKITHSNFNFKRPSLDLTVQHHPTGHNDYEVYEYPGNFGTITRGTKLARVRLEELRSLEVYSEGVSNCCRFATGRTFTVAGHELDSLNSDYVLVTLRHNGTQSHVMGERSGIGGDCSYSNEFLAVPAAVTLRPERLLLKPYVGGLQSALVVGPPGEEIHTDEYGRVRVQFHWDRDGQKTEKSSCWLRISQPWSGQSWGMISIPRVGDEVLVDFINGDPDWPIVVGSVNNAASPALYALPSNKSQTGIRTRSYPNGGTDNFHELRFEDKKGSEEIYLKSEKDWNILVKNDKGETIRRDENLVVGNDRNKSVQMNQSERIGLNKSIRVGGDHQEFIAGNMVSSIDANKAETVGANSAESVALAKEVTVGGLFQVAVGGVMNETVAGAKTEEVGLAKVVVVGADLTENVVGSRQLSVGNHLEITAADSIQITCGNSRLRMESDGSVFINGARLEFSASGIAKVTAEDIQLN